MQDYQDRLTLATAEGIDLSVILAGVGSRILARLIDFFGVWIWIITAGILLAVSLGNFGVALFFVFVFYALFGYDVMCERLFNGRTLGKRVLGLRVQRDSGTRVDLMSSAMRSVLTVIDFLTPLTPLVAVTTVLVTKNNKRLGDLAASTIVIREPKRPKGTVTVPVPMPVSEPPVPVTAGWSPPGAGAAGGATALATRVLDTSAVTREDMAAVNGFLERRHGLKPEIRVDLAARMAGALRSRVGGGIDDLSDEQLLEAVSEAKSRDNG